MATDTVEVLLQPLNRSVRVPIGTPFIEAARKLGIPINLPCGGEGNCGKCRVRVVQGEVAPTEADLRHLNDQLTSQGYRLTCQLTVTSPLIVWIPPEALATGRHQILTATGQIRLHKGTPPFRKIFVNGLDKPEGRSLVEHVWRHGSGYGFSRAALAKLAELAQTERAVTALVAEDIVLGYEPGDTANKNYGVAFDLGTTTLVASLIDVEAGQRLAVTARLNPQTQFGDDIISRIEYTCEKADGLQNLQQAVTESLNEMVEELTRETGISRDNIYQAACAGNTAMQHILCGFHPSSLGRYPFTPVSLEAVSCRASEVGLCLHPEGRLYVFPTIGGFVGGDIVAGLLTSGMLDGEAPAMFVDLGTNGEIVVYDGQRLYAAATAAGPAFEGARISSGMRAANGAIEQIWQDSAGELRYRVIGNELPRGLCGSALLDLLALLLETGLIDSRGKLGDPPEAGEPQNKTFSRLAQRLVFHEGNVAFVVVPPERTATGQPILFTQRDVRQLQLAIGAIRAGTEILLGQLSIAASSLRAVYLAGGFGNYIRRRNAQRVGLLPAEVPTARIQFCGNTSLFGAELAIVSQEARRRAETVARAVEHINLSSVPDFRWRFAEAMIFPERVQSDRAPG